MVRYFDINHAVKEHKKIIKASGGRLSGVLDIGHLLSALDSIKNDTYCPSFESKLTKLVFSVNKNHCFIDGNKRTSITLGAYFLEINDYDYCVGKFIREMEGISVLIADNIITRDFLEEIIFSIIYQDDYNEELQLKIIKAYSKFARSQELSTLGG